MRKRFGRAGIGWRSACAGLAAFVAAVTWSQAGAQSQAASVSGSPPLAARSAEDCAALVRLASLKDTKITSARVVPATGDVPEHCEVGGAIETVILFEVLLPTSSWNGRFFFAGGGGYNGNIPDMSYALARGYATTGTDTGHRGEHWDASALLNDPQAQLNYAHRAAHLVAVAAKEIVAEYYGRPAHHSYFMGCSNGGKMGLMSVQRYPEDFDGVVVGGPVIDRTGLMVMFDWSQKALLGAEIPPYKIPAMSKATLAACDARDGLEDGIIDRPDRCAFDPMSLVCKGDDGAHCLTQAQARAWQAILDGPRDSAGKSLYVGYLPGHEEDYPAYVTGAGVMHGYPSSNFMYMDGFMRWLVFGPDYDPIASFDFDKDPAALAPFVKDQDAVNPDLGAFEARGGRLIMYNGWADHSTPPMRAVQYYEEVKRVHGEDTEAFARLFMIPGYHHCSGGPGPNNFGAAGHRLVHLHDPERDLMGAIVAWVEQGAAPQTIIGTRYVDGDPARGVARTRPFCPYPQVARYVGSGSIDDAANFVCGAPLD